MWEEMVTKWCESGLQVFIDLFLCFNYFYVYFSLFVFFFLDKRQFFRFEATKFENIKKNSQYPSRCYFFLVENFTCTTSLLSFCVRNQMHLCIYVSFISWNVMHALVTCFFVHGTFVFSRKQMRDLHFNRCHDITQYVANINIYFNLSITMINYTPLKFIILRNI